MIKKFFIYLLAMGLFFMIQNTTKAAVKVETAIFAGGCFWCMEHPFEQLPGVIEVVSGYTGGRDKDPTYEEVSSGKTGHLEAVSITYDPGKVGYARLLEVFWRQIDPTDPGGQFADRGPQYASAIFYTTDEQKQLAIESRRAVEGSGRFARAVVTPIIAAGEFYRAQEYHQDYYKKHPLRYKFYRAGSGRDRYLNSIWKNDKERNMDKAGDKFVLPSEDELKARLTPLQYEVTRHSATEAPFHNEYWDNKKAGIYVDIISGEPLFSSVEKFKSGTGWPSFYSPIVPGNIIEKEDRRLFSVRTEVRSARGDSHLGHLFNDGPAPTGQRYCINSAALRFVPIEEMEAEGYGDFIKHFDSKKNSP